MDKENAMSVLAEQLGPYRTKPYAVLKELIGQIDTYEVETPDGLTYQIEMQVFWDDKPDGDIRVIGAINDGKWRAFFPLSDDFIMTPDGAFRGSEICHNRSARNCQGAHES